MLNPHCLLCLVLSYVLKTNCSKMTLQLRIWQWNALTLSNWSTFKGINGLPAIWIMNLALDCVTIKIIPYSIILEFRICNSFFSCKHLRCSFTLNKRFGILFPKKSEIAIRFVLICWIIFQGHARHDALIPFNDARVFPVLGDSILQTAIVKKWNGSL